MEPAGDGSVPTGRDPGDDRPWFPKDRVIFIAVLLGVTVGLLFLAWYFGNITSGRVHPR